MIGSTSFSSGVLTVEGFSQSPFSTSTLTTTQATSDIFVGLGGSGQLHVLGDFGFVSCGGNLYIAPEEHPSFDGTGIVTVGNTSDFAPLLQVNHDLWIGGGFGLGGDATLNIVGNGVVEVSGTTHIGADFFANPDAILRIEGGALNASPELRTTNLTIHEFSVLDFRTGMITIDGGMLDTDSEPLTISGIGGSPRLVLTNGATSTLPDPGFPDPSLALGVATFGGASIDHGAELTLDGDLVMGEQALGVGELHMNTGGSLVAGHVEAGLDGTASISMQSASTLSCKRIRLGVDGAPGSASMTLDGFDTNASVEDGIQIGVFSLLPQTSTMTLSNHATIATGFTFDIERSGRLVIQDLSQATVFSGPLRNNGEIQLEAGFIVADTVLVQTFGKLEGNGWAGPVAVNDGVVSPGLSAGRIEMLDSYTQTANGTLAIELGRFGTGEWDTLAVTGAATLAGTLEVTTLPTFSASPGDQFIILTCGSRVGTFSTVTLNGAPLSASQFSIGYKPNFVYLEAETGTDAPVIASAPLALELLGRRGPEGSFFELAIPVDAQARLSVYDVAGRELQVLRDAPTAAGRHRFELGGRSWRLASGVYFGRAIVTVPGTAPEVRTARVAMVR